MHLDKKSLEKGLVISKNGSFQEFQSIANMNDGDILFRCCEQGVEVAEKEEVGEVNSLMSFRQFKVMLTLAHLYILWDEDEDRGR